MPTLLIDPARIADNAVTIEGPALHHLLRVRRVTEGEPVRCTDGRGRSWEGAITRTKRSALTVALRAETQHAPARYTITLAAAVLPLDRWRWVIEKSVELGVTTIQPLITTRTIVRDHSTDKLDRWRAIAEAAAQQSDRVWFPQVLAPVEWPAFLAHLTPSDVGFCCCPDVLPEASVSIPTTGHILLCIGPEGGFSEEEFNAARAARLRPLSLGPHTLRAETAALAAVAIVGWRGKVS